MQQAQKKDKANRAASDLERVQFLIALDIEEWEEWKKVTKSSDTLMPHRAAQQAQQGRAGSASGATAENQDGPATKRRRPSK